MEKSIPGHGDNKRTVASYVTSRCHVAEISRSAANLKMSIRPIYIKLLRSGHRSLQATVMSMSVCLSVREYVSYYTYSV